MLRILLSGLFVIFYLGVSGQVKGVVTESGNPVIGATVYQKGTTNGITTNANGRFVLTLNETAPFVIIISYTGFETKEFNVSKDESLTVTLNPLQLELKNVEITGSRISEKQKLAPLTVESMDMIAIKECPQNSFYEGLGTLKGVDLTTASLGFTIVNTRGFNSTSPVRSLQLIDGVDNQSPGLNFSLGNFLGSPELDVLKVDMIAGASSAYYGPNAFNGVISMTTRSPFVKPGLEVTLKVGERNLKETAVRWAQVFKDKEGEDKFAYKLNLFYMSAHDWEANNLSPSSDSKDNEKNPGGYDAVNRYGDENITGAYDATSVTQQAFYPGLNRWYRTGYMEKDIVDYNAHNLKLSGAFHYKFTKDIEGIVASSFGTGTTVYQGDNRYSLKDIMFFQNRIEVRKENKFFIRAYATNEDAGNSYDAVYTAILMQNAAKNDDQWGKDYRNYWIYNDIYSRAHLLPGFPPLAAPYDTATANFVLSQYSDTVNAWHNTAENLANKGSLYYKDYFESGTARFDSLLESVTSRKTFKEGGSGFYDKSALYHVQGEYKFTPEFAEIITGGSYRLYKPNSEGTIFSDTSGARITSYEYAAYGGASKKFLRDALILNFTVRMDKNKNFDYLFSPAISAVYTYKANHTFRLSFSSAIRNPTLTDQYLYYNVGRAILLGNISGYDSLVTVESFREYISTPTPNTSKLVYFNVDPVVPEKVKTIEVGYRGTIFEKVYIDANYYMSFYDDFIGYKIGLKLTFDPVFTNYFNSIQAYRIASNAKDMVISQGGSIGVNYYFYKHYALMVNYSYNTLDLRGSTDPLIPAFNTPENKYNIGVNARDVEFNLLGGHFKDIGFNVNYKWIQGFLFEGSPQFTGMVDSYGLVDAQVNYLARKIKTTFKLGASNVLNNKVYQVYGGPEVGRLAYFSISVSI